MPGATDFNINNTDITEVTADGFAHLHLHTQYSMLDGAILVDRLVERAKELNMKSVAITDHGVMFGVVDFYKQMKKAGIKPILGIEAYISPTHRTYREYSRGETSNYHLILLAKNNTGFSNLLKLASIAQLEGFYMRPRIDKEVLKQYKEGIIALSACLGGEIPQKILGGDYQDAVASAKEYLEIMGEGNYYLEIQKNGIPEQAIVNRQLANISKETGIPLVATCDCHYLKRGDHISHTILTCIQTGTTISNPNRMEMASEELYFKSKEEMSEAFSDHPEAILNAAKIASMCNVELDFSSTHLPVYAIPDNFSSPEEYFRHLSIEGLKKRLAKIPEEQHETYHKRLDMEMDVIVLKDYVGYFLIVWDFINYARENNIPVGPGRGSGAGSLVAYSLGITDIDPIHFNLLFERFLNPERPSFPDFDIDFCVKKRDRVIQYVRDKYGHDRVSQIITFGRLSGRSIIRDVCRVLEIPLKEADALAKSIPEAPNMTVSRGLKEDPNVLKAFEVHPKGKEILNHALNLEGLLRHAGMHAAGVVIADKPLWEYVPLARGKGKNGNEDTIEVLAQYEKGLLEELGLVKFDFLGLANLTIIADAVERIHKEIDPNFNISDIPYDDPEIYEMLSNGDSTGVFQLESDGMRRLMKKLQPSVLEDIIALNALYRPGPINGGMLDTFCNRKHGIEKIEYSIAELENILKETYGVIVYQEQVMEIARVVAGYSLGSADMLRRAMGKKDAKEMDRHKQVFLEGEESSNIPGARKLGYDVKKAEDIFELMKEFAEYGFNKSHSAAYAVVAYQTAYLRRKFPAQFLSAAMSAEETKLEKIIPYIDDARMMGINVFPPNINISGTEFEYRNEAIWFGLKSIKNVGAGAAEYIIEEREKNGPYKSIYDLTSRVDLRTVNKKVVESLIYAGAFDCFGKNRNQHIKVMENCMEQGNTKQRMKEKGIMSIEDFLFDAGEEEVEEYYPDVPEMPEGALLVNEKAVLSFYFTSHPVQSAVKIAKDTFDTVQMVQNAPSDVHVKLLGLIKSVRKLLTKNKDSMASFIIEDLTGNIDCVIFPRVYANYMTKLEPESIVVVEGTWKNEGDRSSIHVDAVHSFVEALEKHTLGLEITVGENNTTKEHVDRLTGIILQHKGQMPVTINFDRGNGYSVKMPLPQNMRIKPTEEMLEQLNIYCGKGSYQIIENARRDSALYKFEQLYIEESRIEAFDGEEFDYSL